MIKAINNNRYFKFFQPKLFYINHDIDKDDSVRFLSAILEEKEDKGTTIFRKSTILC